MRDQSARLREDVAEPLLPSQEDAAFSDRWTIRRPDTTNPIAEELRFEAAPEDRDAGARLQQLLAASGDVTDALIAGGAGTQGSETPAAQLALRTISLEEALRLSQRSGREFLTAQEDYLLAAIRLLQERHRWGPRLFNDSSAFVGAQGVDGSFDPALNLVNTLRATQRLPSGGEVEARWVWDATEFLREQSTNGYVSSSELVLAGRVPLLRGAGSVAREELIQAERDLVYQSREFERFRREYLVDIAQDYFQLLETRATIANQFRQLDSLTKFATATRARVDAGRLEAFQTAITDSQVRSAISTLAGLRDQYVLQRERFRVRLGMPEGERFDVSDELFSLPEPMITLEEAVSRALEYRLDVQNSADRLNDTRRGVANAKNDLLPDLNVSGEVGVPTDPDNDSPGLAPDADSTRYRVGATLSLPLDRDIERLSVRAAQIRLERAQRTHQRLLDDVAVNARAAVRGVELARLQLRLAEDRVEINRRRLRGQRLQEDTLRPQDLVDTENELLDSENARDRARTRLRTAVLNYLLETDQLRVARDGTLLALPGF